jgi:3-dehydroquinate synthase
MKKIKVNLGNRGYEILVQNGLLKNIYGLIREATSAKKIAVLSSPIVFKLYGKLLLGNLKKINVNPRVFLIPDGEVYKNQKYLFLILKKMSEWKFQRDSCLITLGGGVIGDLGGLAASIYMRGIDFIQCPTTLLAQVDASIGGKTAIDFAGFKNIIGTFYQPKLVLIDPEVLKTLNDRQFRTGLAEVIKYGVIYDDDLFRKLEKNIVTVLARDVKLLNHIISRSCEIKAKIVSEDERENGKRAWLNYGHTLGHALESYYRYKVITHGEAISYGMRFASLLSLKLGFCTQSIVDHQFDLIKRAGLFRKLPRFQANKVYRKMFLDKKARKGKIQFILTRKIGLVSIQENVPKSIIFSALNQIQAEVSEFL